ncbi:TBPIP-domain-containing protein [Tothia fuscella]|uniref:TBPIP-domain-containing protein n=1 Tax=Tothia fuscella TaxID=1048955 RepID=A0A9P4NY82_9PEZI|nr:TBPIP-domain-containing protein [Tothia fuscella]
MAKEKSEKAPKEKKVSADEANDMVLNYLKKQNRPYSSADISANLHNKVTKTAAVKILKVLVEKKEIVERQAGKQSVFHMPQNAEEGPTPEDLAEMETRTEELREETATLNETLKSLRATYSKLNSTLSTADLRESVTILESERVQIIERLTLLRSGTIQPVSKEEKDKVDKDFKIWDKTASARKKIAAEMWSMISANCADATAAAVMREGLGLDD